MDQWWSLLLVTGAPACAGLSLAVLLFPLILDQNSDYLLIPVERRCWQLRRCQQLPVSLEMKGMPAAGLGLWQLLITLQSRACVSHFLSFKEVSFLCGRKICKSQRIQRCARTIHVKNELDSSTWAGACSELFFIPPVPLCTSKLLEFQLQTLMPDRIVTHLL